jgi:hypothetical protein
MKGSGRTAPGRRLAGVQWHPEVLHTEHRQLVLQHFLYDIAGCTRAGRQGYPGLNRRNCSYLPRTRIPRTPAWRRCQRCVGCHAQISPPRCLGVVVGALPTGGVTARHGSPQSRISLMITFGFARTR